MKYIGELALFCALFTALVKAGVGNSALNGLFFYPKPVQERVYELGLTDRETVKRKRIRFMVPFVLIMADALIGMVRGLNQVRDFRTAWLQSLFFLEGMNWYDGIVIDRLWVGHDPFWAIQGTEGIPYVQTWKQVLLKRSILSAIWFIGAGIAAGLVVIL